MGARLARLRRFRPDPLTLDRTLAAVLTVGAEPAQLALAVADLFAACLR